MRKLKEGDRVYHISRKITGRLHRISEDHHAATVMDENGNTHLVFFKNPRLSKLENIKDFLNEIGR